MKNQELNQLVFNLSRFELTETDYSLLNKGLSFIPSQGSDLSELLTDLRLFGRTIALKLLFNNDNVRSTQNINRFKCKSSFTPPFPANVECSIRLCENDLYSYFKKHERKCTYFNLNKEQQASLYNLSHNSELTIKPADKGGGAWFYLIKMIIIHP